jgi:Cu(I)/Ag(I) efflux system membrane fusion protein
MSRIVQQLAVVVPVSPRPRGTGSRRGTRATAGGPAAERTPDRKVLYWYDPMYPQQRFDKPGNRPSWT